ncbi:hypothetical protein ACLOJK_038454 [Asimina triloba]
MAPEQAMQQSAQLMQWLDPADASSDGLQQQRPSSNADHRQPVAHPINGIRPSSRRSTEPIQDPGASIGSRRGSLQQDRTASARTSIRQRASDHPATNSPKQAVYHPI